MGRNEVFCRLPEGAEPPVAEINLNNSNKVMECIKAAKAHITRVQTWKNEFTGTNDPRKETQIKENISMAFEHVSGNVARVSHLLSFMRKELEEKKIFYQDPHCEDSRLRILSATIAILQQKVYLLIKDFNKLQLEIKYLYRDKMTRQLSAYDPSLNEEKVTELINDPQVD